MGFKSDLFNELNAIKTKIYDNKKNYWVETMLKERDNIIATQQHTIDYLIDALRGKYEHGLFIFMEEGKHTPTIIKDGQVLTDGKVCSVDINWAHDVAPSITIEYAGGVIK